MCKIFSASMPVYKMRTVIVRDFTSFSMLRIGATFAYILIKKSLVGIAMKAFEFEHEF